MQGRQQPRKASLMAKIRALVSNFYLKQRTKKRQKDTTYAIM